MAAAASRAASTWHRQHEGGSGRAASSAAAGLAWEEADGGAALEVADTKVFGGAVDRAAAPARAVT